MRIIAALITSALVLSGCGHNYPADTPLQVTDALQRVYTGIPANEFFYSYGLPVGEFERTNGSRIYRWSTLQPAPGSNNTPVQHYHSKTGNYHIVDNYQGVTQMQYCELRIYVDEHDIIYDFAIAVDSMGKWSSSRCSELFAAPVRK